MNPSPNVCMTLPGDFVCGSSFVHVAFVRRYSDNQTTAAQQCAAPDARLRLAPVSLNVRLALMVFGVTRRGIGLGIAGVTQAQASIVPSWVLA
jgi:hypothetical protein